MRYVAAALLAGLGALAALPAAAAPPVRLVLVIAVDQLRADRLDPALPGGLGRLAREGRVFTDAVLAHALTETCPGHATMLTGRHPAHVGIPANEFFDAESGAQVYCAADPSPAAQEIGSKDGLSPVRLGATTLGDWLKAATPASRVFAVSGKDRGAIMMAGQHPDAAYWFRGGAAPMFTTSRYYRADLPAWAAEFNGAHPPQDGFLASLPERWEYGPLEHAKTPDDFPGESTRFSRTSPHPLRDPDLSKLSDQFFMSPYLDLATLDFATRLVSEEKLGEGPATDLLALSLSATDSVGHLYGPWSQESQDALERLDAALGTFLALLEARTGGALVVALTADHGVLPLPEWLAQNGQATCPDPSGRPSLKRIGGGLLLDLWWEFGPRLAWPREWIHFASTEASVDRALAKEQGVATADVAREAKAYLESWPVIAHVWTPEEIATTPGDLAELYRHSFVPGRSGDFVIEPAEGCLISPYDTGTSHGTPWLYDRRVPLLVRAPGVAPARVGGPAATIDLGPTLAALLGISAPADLDGRALPLAGAPAAP